MKQLTEHKTPSLSVEEKLSRTGHEPGVYLLKDENNVIIYIGKALDLRKRLAAYFKNSGHADMKTGVLVHKIFDFDTIITANEKEALILESNLIKRHRPRYNVVLKDDKRYPSLRRCHVLRPLCFSTSSPRNPQDHKQNLQITKVPCQRF